MGKKHHHQAEPDPVHHAEITVEAMAAEILADAPRAEVARLIALLQEGLRLADVAAQPPVATVILDHRARRAASIQAAQHPDHGHHR